MTDVAVPSSAAARSKSPMKLLMPLLIVLVVIGGGAGVYALATSGGGPKTDLDAGLVDTAKMVEFGVSVRKDGELAAVDSVELVSRVEGQTTIVEIVPEGSFVKKGDVLIRMDTSEINGELEEATLRLRQAEAELVNAREQLAIQESKNQETKETADVELKLSRLDLSMFEDGTYPQDVENKQTAKVMAEITLKNKEEDFALTRSLFSKGFVTAAEVKKRQLELSEARNNLAKAATELDVLKTYTYAHDLAEKQNKLKQAENKLDRTDRENKSNLALKEAEVQSKERVMSIHQRRLAHVEEQLAATTMVAPTDGLFVYNNDRRGNDQPIQQGTSVRERQTIASLPDTSRMKAVVKVNESQVGKLEEGLRATVQIVGELEPIGAEVTYISVLADSGNRWWNPDLKEYKVDLVLDRTPKGAKPGVGVMAEIFIDPPAPTLAVPLASVYTRGDQRYVFAPSAQGVKALPVSVGRTNSTHAEILDGITDGQRVVLLQPGQGRELLDQAENARKVS